MIYQLVKGLSKLTSKDKLVLPDIIMLDFTIVKAYMIRVSVSDWVLIDTGLESSYEFIINTAKKYFDEQKPKAIILTHGHFDHIGSVIKLTKHWNINVYAHEMEIPYLTGKKNYPKGDSYVDEGLIAKMSPYFPHEGIDIEHKLIKLNSNNTIPDMQGWRWIHTPGHCDGHISLFRDSDKVLILGDAFTTTKQESLLSVLSNKEIVKGPPAYLTTDWQAAKKSIEILRELHPALVLPSHGDIIEGEELTNHINYLIEHFEEIAIPERGKHIK